MFGAEIKNLRMMRDGREDTKSPSVRNQDVLDSFCRVQKGFGVQSLRYQD